MSNCPCDATVKTRGELPYPNPFDEGDCGAQELPSLGGLYDDCDFMQFGCVCDEPIPLPPPLLARIVCNDPNAM